MRKNKKGFTIVELVIVIAVIAVLAAVLVPTFIHLSGKAKEASDNSLVNTLNTHLRIQEAENGKDARNMSEAVQYLKKEGIYASQLVTKSDKDLVYSIDDHQFYLSNDEKVDQNNKHKYFHIYDDVPEEQTWSIYASDSWSKTAVGTLTVGFDAGETSGVVSSLTFNGTTNANKEAVIVTNWEETSFTIEATEGVIYHYGLAGQANIIKCGMSSYHERGNLGYAELNDGRIVADVGGKVVNVLQVSSTAKVDVNGGEVCDVYGNSTSTDEKNGNVDVHPYDSEQPSKDDLIDEGKDEATGRVKLTQAKLDLEGRLELESKTYYLVEDLTIDSTTLGIYGADLDVTIDLNGHSISSTVSKAFTFERSNVRFTGEGFVNNNRTLSDDDSYALMLAKCSLIIEGGYFGGTHPVSIGTLSGNTDIYVRGGSINGLIACDLGNIVFHNSGTYKIVSWLSMAGIYPDNHISAADGLTVAKGSEGEINDFPYTNYIVS